MAITVDQKGYGLAGQKFSLSSGTPGRLGVLLFRVTIICLVVVIIGTGWLFFSWRGLNKDVTATKKAIEEVQANQRTADAQKFVVVQSQLRALKGILENHVYGSQVIEFVESIAHPRVRFDGFGVNLSDRKVSVSVTAANYTAVAEQLKILDADSRVSEFTTGSFKNSQTGTVSFSLSIGFKDEVLRKK
ncbi:hypothetical protein C4553_02120 [Candidatus Parcubacteria bacterium]|nr:MAG: hypothetical protein C4553_02120 [Candidatus Parcubacteria bacterium]